MINWSDEFEKFLLDNDLYSQFIIFIFGWNCSFSEYIERVKNPLQFISSIAPYEREGIN